MAQGMKKCLNSSYMWGKRYITGVRVFALCILSQSSIPSTPSDPLSPSGMITEAEPEISSARWASRQKIIHRRKRKLLELDLTVI